MLRSLHINQLQEFLKKQEVFTTMDLLSFYKRTGPDITKTTLNWRIHELVHKGYIKRLGRGLFGWGTANEFIPKAGNTLIKVHAILEEELPYAKTCLWDTTVFNSWMLHQPSHFYSMVEVEKDALESAFNVLREKFNDIFLQPDKEVLAHYASNKSAPLLVLPLISEAPIQEVELNQRKKITTVAIEKIIVDIFCEPDIFDAQQGREMTIIYNNIFSSYTINPNKMLRYANRRSKKEAILQYLDTKTNFRHIYKKVPF